MRSIKIGLLALAATTAIAGHAYSAGFYIQEQSVSGLGAAFAGQQAMPRDASVIFFNPAGMTYLQGTQGNLGVHFLMPKSDLDDTGSDAPLALSNGGESSNPYNIEPVPNVHLSYQLNDRNWLGVSVTAPFGLANDYSDDWFGRFDSLSSELTTINVQPSFAHKINDRLSIGAGIDIQYVDATLVSAAYAGGTEGTSTLAGDDVSFGYNIGLLYDVNDDTSLGLHYRSQVNHKLDGEVTVVGTTNVDGITNGKANLNLPDMISFGATHDLNDKWQLLGGVTWFGWSNYSRITVLSDAGTQISNQRQNYKDTWAVNVGAEYAYSPDWTLRGGVQFDQTPTQDGFRTTRTPDGDRVWLTGGATYDITDRMSLDMAAAYIHVANEEIDTVQNAGTAVVSSVNADTSGQVGIVSFGLNYKF